MENSHFLISFGPSHAKVEVSEPVPRTGDPRCQPNMITRIVLMALQLK